MTEETPLWLVRHVEKQLNTRFLNARQIRRGAFKRGWLVNTSDGAVAVSRASGGEPTLHELPFPDDRQGMTCTVCDWRMEFVGTDFPIRAYCSNCGCLHEMWHDGSLQRRGEPQVTMPTEVLQDAPMAQVESTVVATKRAKAPAKKAAKPKAPAKTAKPAKKAAAAYVDYKGDIDPVLDVEGIGPTYADRLVQAGVKTTARLCYEGPAKIAKITKAPLKTATTWHANAELMKINGVGPQYAEAMARAGIGGIDELKRLKADTIANRINTYLDSLDVNVLGTKITPRRVEGWQKKAAPMRKVRQKVPQE